MCFATPLCIASSLWYKRSCCSADRLTEAVASRVSAEPETRAAMSLGGGGFNGNFMGKSGENDGEIKIARFLSWD